MELNFELLRIIAAVIFAALAGWEDLKTSYISDKWLFSMIGIGGILTLLSFDLNFILAAAIPAALILAIGFLMYRFGQLGMGDVLLFVGLQLLLPFSPALFKPPIATAVADFVIPISSSIPFFLVVLTTSSLFALIGSSIMYLKFYLEKKLKPSKESIALFLFMILPIPLLSIFVRLNLSTIIIFTVLFIPVSFMVAFKRQIYDKIIIEMIPISKIEDEDILALEKLPKEIVKKYQLENVLTKSAVEKLKKVQKLEGMKKFPVCKILPRFGPYVFAGLIFSILFGDIFLMFLLY